MPAAEHTTFGPYTYTPREWQFVLEYSAGWNGTEAAKRAKYAPSSAHVTASRLLKKPKIDYAIKKRMKKVADRCDVTAERVMKQLAAIAFADIGELMKWDEERVTFVPSSDLTAEQRSAIAAVKAKVIGYTDDGQEIRSLEVKRADQLKALELIGRRLGMWRDRIDVNLSNLSDEQLAAIAAGREPER